MKSSYEQLSRELNSCLIVRMYLLTTYKDSFGAKILGDDCALNLSDQCFCVRSFLFHVSIHKRRFAKQVPQLSIKPFPRYYIFSLSGL